MPVCSMCQQDQAKADFSASQLKKRAQRCCSPCLAAAEMRKKMEDLPAPSAENLLESTLASCRVEERPGRGRVLVAARSFKAGEIVLREPPTLFWDAGNVGDLISGFLALTPDEQKEILEMASPDIESDLDQVTEAGAREEARATRLARQAARHTLAVELAKEYEGSPRLLELIESLLTLGDCNAHAFQSESVGLFPLAALANHSCDPSCAHTTSVANEMRFYATRPIATGSEITISYIPNLLATPCAERRETLLAQKLFFCRCDRCLAADHCRGLRCCASATSSGGARPSSVCSGFAVSIGGEHKDGWQCGSCNGESTGAAMADRVAAEAKLLLKAQELAGRIDRASKCVSSPDEWSAIYEDVQAMLRTMLDDLSPSHHLGPQLLAKLVAAPGLDTRMLSSVAAQSLAWQECAAAGCHSRDCARAGITKHAPRAELVGEAVTAAIASAKSGTKELLALSAVISSRYVLLATRQFGPEDRSVKTMRAVLDKVVPTEQPRQAARQAEK